MATCTVNSIWVFSVQSLERSRKSTGKFVYLRTTPWDTSTSRVVRQWNMLVSPAGLEIRNKCANESQQLFTRPQDSMETNKGFTIAAECRTSGCDHISTRIRPLVHSGWKVMETVWQYTSQNLTRYVVVLHFSCKDMAKNVALYIKTIPSGNKLWLLLYFRRFDPYCEASGKCKGFNYTNIDSGLCILCTVK
jgi:hypothetical protein